MGDRRDKNQDQSGRTGEMPTVRDSGSQREPPMPNKLPEIANTLDGVTGRFRIVPEGEDKARQKDDSATRTAPAPAPTARTSR
jgi:hypothetical protein